MDTENARNPHNPEDENPPRRSSLRCCGHRIIPVLFFALFLVAGAVTLSFTLHDRRAPPRRLTISIAWAFCGIFGLGAIVYGLMWLRCRYEGRESVGSGDKSPHGMTREVREKFKKLARFSRNFERRSHAFVEFNRKRQNREGLARHEIESLEIESHPSLTGVTFRRSRDLGADQPQVGVEETHHQRQDTEQRTTAATNRDASWNGPNHHGRPVVTAPRPGFEQSNTPPQGAPTMSFAGQDSSTQQIYNSTTTPNFRHGIAHHLPPQPTQPPPVHPRPQANRSFEGTRSNARPILNSDDRFLVRHPSPTKAHSEDQHRNAPVRGGVQQHRGTSTITQIPPASARNFPARPPTQHMGGPEMQPQGSRLPRTTGSHGHRAYEPGRSTIQPVTLVSSQTPGSGSLRTRGEADLVPQPLHLKSGGAGVGAGGTSRNPVAGPDSPRPAINPTDRRSMHARIGPDVDDRMTPPATTDTSKAPRPPILEQSLPASGNTATIVTTTRARVPVVTHNHGTEDVRDAAAAQPTVSVLIGDDDLYRDAIDEATGAAAAHRGPDAALPVMRVSSEEEMWRIWDRRARDP
ncbi:hypothetical protein PVAG01_04920 [Phlyctema vagabunda]|uniref:Uncharacterized protein n=1 Tax=Phlyctema vagabunda TaxID=108571 RepID=A0ABR4PIV3_9HELO